MSHHESDQWVNESSHKNLQAVESSHDHKAKGMVHDGASYLKEARKEIKHVKKDAKVGDPSSKREVSSTKPNDVRPREPVNAKDLHQTLQGSEGTERLKKVAPKKEVSMGKKSPSSAEKPLSPSSPKETNLKRERLKSYGKATVKFSAKQGAESIYAQTGLKDTVVEDVKQSVQQVRATKDGLKAGADVVSQVGKGTTQTMKTGAHLMKNRRRIYSQVKERMLHMLKGVGQVLKNPLVLVKGASLGTLLILIAAVVLVVVATLSSITSSFVLKTEEKELTNTWEYLTKLDAEQTVRLQKGKNPLVINEATASREGTKIISNGDDWLGYLDVLYEDFELSKLVNKEEAITGEQAIKSLYQRLYRTKTEKEEEQVTIGSIEDLVNEQKEQAERFNTLKEVGQYQSLVSFSPLISGQGQLLISQRFGYYAQEQKVKQFNGIRVQATENAIVNAPMTGEVTLKGETVIIEADKERLEIEGISSSLAEGQKVNAGDTIGKVASEEDIALFYKKKGQPLNPAFYFPEVTYLESTSFGFSTIGASFDEALFKRIIQTRCNAFSDKADKIIIEAKKAGVNPVIFASIMIHESAWGTSTAIKEHNNPSGQMTSSGIIHYNTLDEGIEATGRTLKNLIVARNLHTVEALGSVYCPVGAANDPLGLNKHWVPAIKGFMETLGGSGNMSLLWSSASGKSGKLLEFADSLYGKGVIYSMGSNRGNFPYHDCSSFVTTALKAAGLDVYIGSTEYLYSLEGSLLQPISRSEVQPGDIFVWGNKGGSGGAYGHTGIFLDEGGKTIIHCTPSTNQKGNIVKTPFEGYYGTPSLAPVYFYRVK